MISTKKLIKMAKKWQKFVVTNKKRIAFHRDNTNGDECTTTTAATTTFSILKARKGYFVVYSVDQHRFEIPLICLKNEIFEVLLEMSEKEFGLSNEGAIVLPIDRQELDFIISVIKRGATGDVQKTLLSSVAMSRRSISSLHQEIRHGQLLVY